MFRSRASVDDAKLWPSFEAFFPILTYRYFLLISCITIFYRILRVMCQGNRM